MNNAKRDEALNRAFGKKKIITYKTYLFAFDTYWQMRQTYLDKLRTFKYKLKL